MGELFSGVNVSALTPVGLAGLAVLLIIRGYLVPRVTHRELMENKDSQIQTWQTAYENERKARAMSDAQTSELLSLARATNALLQALPKVGRWEDTEDQ